jgi:carboxylesterase
MMMSKKPLGAVLIHGFPGKPEVFGKLAGHIESLGLPYQAPTLEGHAAPTPDALKGVNWRQWIADGERAMFEVLSEAEKVIIIGHSMGGWIGLNLAADHGEKIDSLIVAGSSLRTVSPFGPGRPFHFLVPFVLKVKKKWDNTPIFAQSEHLPYDSSYKWVPTEAFTPVFDILKAAQKRSPEVKVPILILQSKNDTTNSPEGAQVLYDRISTPRDLKQLVWFERTGHIMFLDCEQEEVNRTVLEYIRARQNRSNS